MTCSQLRYADNTSHTTSTSLPPPPLHLIHSVSFLQFLSDLFTHCILCIPFCSPCSCCYLLTLWSLSTTLWPQPLTLMCAPPFTARSHYRAYTPPPVHDAMSLHKYSSWRDDLSSAWMLGVVHKQGSARIKDMGNISERMQGEQGLSSFHLLITEDVHLLVITLHCV